MKKYKLSIIIPSRSEEFLKNTVEDIIKNKRGDTEIIVGLDGEWSNPPLIQHPDVNVIYTSKSIGQRGMAKLCARLSKSCYIMKVDAHCSFDEGFDVKMIEAMDKAGDNTTMVPIMRNLWVFDWKCHHCGKKKYQGPKPEKCEDCGKSDKIRKKIVWIGKHNPQSTSYCFDSTPHFKYFEAYKHRPKYIKDKKEKKITETMSLQGSCFMMTREKYFSLNVDDENFGSWGNQGMSVACATWLSGGKVLVNHATWYSHLFRTKSQDFGFPYPQSGRDVQKTKKNVVDKFWKMKHHKQIYPVSWLVKRFWKVYGWSDEDLKQLEEYESKIKK